MLTVHSGHDIRLLNLPTKQAIRQALAVSAEDKLEGVRRLFNRYYEVKISKNVSTHRKIYLQNFYTQNFFAKSFLEKFFRE